MNTFTFLTLTILDIDTYFGTQYKLIIKKHLLFLNIIFKTNNINKVSIKN